MEKPKMKEVRVTADKQLTPEQLEMVFKQGVHTFKNIEASIQAALNEHKDEVKTLEDALKFAWEIIKELPAALDENLPFYEAFIKPLKLGNEKEGMVYSYVGNVFVTPLVMATTDMWYTELEKERKAPKPKELAS